MSFGRESGSGVHLKPWQNEIDRLRVLDLETVQDYRKVWLLRKPQAHDPLDRARLEDLLLVAEIRLGIRKIHVPPPPRKSVLRCPPPPPPPLRR